MALNLSNITVYTDQVSGKLIRQILLAGETTKWVTVQPTIKYAEAINLLSNSIYLQAGTSGWSSSGTTTLTQRNITVSPIQVQQNFQLYGANSLEQFWAGQSMKPGSGTDGGSLPFEEVFTTYLSDQIQQRVDYLIWGGNYAPVGAYTAGTTTATGDLLNATGFLSILDAASASTVQITYSGAPTVANVGTIVDSIVAGLPSNILAEKDILIFCSPATVQLYKLAIRNSNNYHYYVDDTSNTNTLTQTVPGFGNVKVVGVVGMTGQGRMICSYASNFVVGTDLTSEIDPAVFALWYSMDFQELRFNSRLKIGVNVAFPQYVVVY